MAGTNTTFEVNVPSGLLQLTKETKMNNEEMTLEIKPLSIGAFHLILKAARDDAGLIPLLILTESLVNPKLSLEQVKKLQLGLVEYLIAEVKIVSGLSEKKKILTEIEQSPLARSSFVLAREFGWTPSQIQELTMAQVSLYLQMIQKDNNLGKLVPDIK